MNNEGLITAVYSGIFLSLFALGELLYNVFKFKAETTRKIVHFGTGFICFSFPLYITEHWSVLFLTISFVLLLVLSMKFKFLKSINGIDRKTNGSFLFPISIYMIFWAYSIIGKENYYGGDLIWTSSRDINGVLNNTDGVYYFLPLLIFSVSDPLAALFGKKWPFGKYTILKETKTVVGSIVFLLSSFCISLLFMTNQSSSLSSAIIISLILGVSTTLAEGISQKGFDNILIPITAIAILFIIK